MHAGVKPEYYAQLLFLRCLGLTHPAGIFVLLQAAEAVVRQTLVAPVVQRVVAEHKAKSPLAGPAGGKHALGMRSHAP